MLDLSDLWLAVDPGEDSGWSLWKGDQFIDAGTAKLWELADAVWMAVFSSREELELIGDELALRFVGIRGIVCEDFRIYPKEAKAGTLNWDPVRTARLIGALTIIARMGGLWFRLQGANIKERGLAAGAKSFFLSPLYENRHANDATTHGVYLLAVNEDENDAP